MDYTDYTYCVYYPVLRVARFPCNYAKHYCTDSVYLNTLSMPGKRRSNLFLDMDVDKQLDISYNRSGERRKEDSPNYIGPVDTPAEETETHSASPSQETASGVQEGSLEKTISEPLEESDGISRKVQGEDSSEVPSGDSAEGVVELPSEAVQPAGLPVAVSEARKKKAPQRKGNKAPQRDDKNIAISRDVYCLLVFEKARLAKQGREAVSFGTLIKEVFARDLKRSEKATYEFYKSMGIVD